MDNKINPDYKNKIKPDDKKTEEIRNTDGKSGRNEGAADTGDNSDPWLWSFMVLVFLIEILLLSKLLRSC